MTINIGFSCVQYTVYLQARKGVRDNAYKKKERQVESEALKANSK